MVGLEPALGLSNDKLDYHLLAIGDDAQARAAPHLKSPVAGQRTLFGAGAGNCSKLIVAPMQPVPIRANRALGERSMRSTMPAMAQEGTV